MEKEWKKLIDEVENNRSYNANPNFKFVDFIREKSTIEDKRAIVQEVERRIKKVVNREDNSPDGFFRNFSFLDIYPFALGSPRKKLVNPPSSRSFSFTS